MTSLPPTIIMLCCRVDMRSITTTTTTTTMTRRGLPSSSTHRSCVLDRQSLMRFALIDLGEVLERRLDVIDHCRLTWLPTGWAHLTVLVRVLECLDEPDGLVDVTAHLFMPLQGINVYIHTHTIQSADRSIDRDTGFRACVRENRVPEVRITHKKESQTRHVRSVALRQQQQQVPVGSTCVSICHSSINVYGGVPGDHSPSSA